MLAVLVSLIVCFSTIANTFSNVTINMPLLYYYDPHGVYKLVVDNTISVLRETNILPPWISIRFFFYHECHRHKPLGVMVDLSRNIDIDVMVGPACTRGMVPVSLFGTYMKILSLGYVSSGTALADKTLFKYLARFFPTHNQLMHGVISIAKFYGWKQVAVIRLDSRKEGCHLVGSAVDELLKSKQLVVNYMVQIGPMQKDFTKVLMEVCSRARIIIMCNSYKYATKSEVSTRDVLIVAQQLGMVTPEYVWLLIQPINNHVESPPWKLHFGTETDLQENQAIRAYRSAIIIKPEGSNERNLRPIDQLTLRAWNVSIYDLKSTYAIQFPFLNDAIYSYGIAINKSINMNNLTVDLSGPNMIDYFRCITFEGFSGTVSLDRFAERITSYTLFSFDANESFSFMGVFQGYVKDCAVSDKIDFKFIAGRTHLWGTGSANVIPLDEPECGFEGEMCNAGENCVSSTALSNQYKCYYPAHHGQAFSDGYGIVPEWSYDIILAADRKYMEGLVNPSIRKYYVTGGMFAVFVLFGLLFVRWKRNRDAELELYGIAWKAQPTDIKLLIYSKLKIIQTIKSIRSMNSLQSMRSVTREAFVNYEKVDFNEYSKNELDAVYQNNSNVKLKTYIKRNDFSLHRDHLIILKSLRRINHENLNNFRGLCLDHEQVISFLWQRSERGSLEDLIFADEIDLDTVFKTSMIRDLAKGLDYLHRSDIEYHGELTASACVVSSRWIVRIQNFGAFRIVNDLVQSENVEKPTPDTKVLLHFAPEVLRNESLNNIQWQQNDIYALAMILYQIITRESLFFNEPGSPDDIISKIINRANDGKMRPTAENNTSNEQTLLDGLIQQMWHEDPVKRPDITDVKSKVNLLMKGYSKNIMDHMLLMMEKYTDNLESIVKERTHQVEEEHKRAEALLCQLLPPSIASDLKKGLAIVPESFECVTIFFSDIVGFTSTCSLCTPIQVVTMLNALFSLVDKIVSRFDVYKVETIGDSYLIVSGLPVRNGDKHVQEIPSMALAIRDGLGGYVIRHLVGRRIQMRFGIHSGSVAAGVIGSVMPRYCLFGDSVNLASRMESTSEAMRIQITEETKVLVERSVNHLFNINYRGEIQVKGKGNQRTYWIDKPMQNAQ